MTSGDTPRSRPRLVVEVLYLLVALSFFVELFRYFLTGSGGPTLLAVTLVPITFVLFTLDALRKDELYPRLGPAANYAIAFVYAAIAIAVAVYMHVEFIAIGTVRAGFWSTTDLVMGGLMAVLIMEYARKRYFVLFVLNIVLDPVRGLRLAGPGHVQPSGPELDARRQRDERRDGDRRVLGAAPARADADRLVHPGAERAARLRLHRFDPARGRR